MKKQNGKLSFASAIVMGTIIGFSGCALYEPAQGVYGPPESFGIEEDDTASSDQISPEAEVPTPAEDEELSEKEYDPALVFTWPSDDPSLSVVQDYNSHTSCIVDGDEEIPVDIAMGVYGARVVKCDIDGDGEDEYLISECEGTGSGYSVRGLCIVEKTDDGYKQTVYDGEYFMQVIEDRVIFAYDAESRDLTISAVNDKETYVYIETLEGEDEVDDIIWRDQIGVYFEDGKVYMSSSVGFFFKGHGWPEYEQSVELYAPITVDTDSQIVVGDIQARDGDGVKD